MKLLPKWRKKKPVLPKNPDAFQLPAYNEIYKK